MLIFPRSTCCCLLRPVAAGQKYLSNRSMRRTGQGNPNKFSPKTINNTHLRFEVSGENVSVAEKKKKKRARAPLRPPHRRRVSIGGENKRQRFIYQLENTVRPQSEDCCLFDFIKCRQTQSSSIVSIEKNHVNIDLLAMALFTLDFKGAGVITPLLHLTVLCKRQAAE